MAFWKQEEAPEYVEGKTDYTKSQLGLMADELLRKDSKRELCRACLEDEVEEPYGLETGVVDTRPLREKNGDLKLDDEGNVIVADYPQFECSNGHVWFLGEGKDRGIQGNNAILFEEHLQTRRKREIYTTVGTPDPSIVIGIYNRTHPQGRKVNSPEQRKKNGASFFR